MRIDNKEPHFGANPNKGCTHHLYCTTSHEWLGSFIIRLFVFDELVKSDDQDLGGVPLDRSTADRRWSVDRV